jgi:hypothetical protein
VEVEASGRAGSGRGQGKAGEGDREIADFSETVKNDCPATSVLFSPPPLRRLSFSFPFTSVSLIVGISHRKHRKSEKEKRRSTTLLLTQALRRGLVIITIPREEMEGRWQKER